MTSSPARAAGAGSSTSAGSGGGGSSAAPIDKLKSEFEKLSIPKKDVTDTTNSFSSPVTYYFPCDQGATYQSVNTTIQTRLAKFDPSIAHLGGAITGGIYVWKCSITVSNGKMTINCNNELMLNSAALAQSTEKDPAIKQIEDLVVYYHELLHGQLMIDAIKSSQSWQYYTCNTPIQQDLDYSSTDADHLVITQLQTEFAKRLIEDEGGFFKVETITPDQTNAGTFSKKIGSLYDYPEYVKSGIDISARSYNVADIKITSHKNDIIINGILNDKSKNGIVWLYVFGKESSNTIQLPKPTPKPITTPPKQISIPDWVKDLGKWWSDGTINDQEFLTGIKYMIENGIITIPQTTPGQTNSQPIPYWVKNNAKWWSQGTISDADFVAGLQYLIQNGIMNVKIETWGEMAVVLLHYAAGELIEEIKTLNNLTILSKRPVFRSFPLFTEYRHFKKVVREFKPDIIHTGYVWQVGILASMLDFHPHLSMVWGSDVLTEPDRNYFIKRIVHKVMHQCDHIQCDAMFVKNKIISDYKLPGEKITVFPWGIDLGRFKRIDRSACRQKQKIETKKFVVIFNRYLEPRT